LWDALANYDQPPTCKCGGFTCDLGSILNTKREEKIVHTFLMGLDDIIYDIIRSNILAHDPLLNLNKVYSILIQKEQVQTMACGKEDRWEVMAFTIRGRVDGKDKTMICSYYKRSGHNANSCFVLIRYPEWRGDKLTDRKNEGRGRGSQSTLQHGKDKTMICSHCKRSGHDTNSCFGLIGYPEWWGDRLRTDRKNGGRGRGSQSSLQEKKRVRPRLWFCAGQCRPDHTWKLNHRNYIRWEWRGISWAKPWTTLGINEIAKRSK